MPQPHAPVTTPDGLTAEPVTPATIDHPTSSPELPHVPDPGARFVPRELHAKGGLGEVYVADDRELGRFVALKEMQPRVAGDEVCRRRFVREAELTGRLEHPGVVPVYGLGTHPDGRPYYAMRFIRGQTLLRAIDRYHQKPRGPASRLAFRELLQRFVAVCNAIAFAHSRGVIHRDLKPENIMLGEFGETLVVDWGLAKRVGDLPEGERRLTESLDGTTGQTLAGSAVGTPEYMAPEQAAGQLADLGPASDVYSLGATLYTLLVGRPAIRGTTTLEAVAAAAGGQFPRPRSINAAVPAALEAVCVKAMALRPADRYASPRDLAADVERWLADEPVSCHRDSLVVRLARTARRHRTKFAAGLALLCSAAVALTAGLVLVGGEQRQTALARDQAVQAFNEMTGQVVEGWLAKQSGKPTAEQEKFLVKAAEFYDEFARTAGNSGRARDGAANAHARLGVIRRQLGQKAEALADYDRAQALYQALAADYPDELRYRQRTVEMMHGRGVLFHETGRLPEAEATLKEAIDAGRALAVPGNPRDAERVAMSLITLANTQSNANRNAESEASYRAAADLLRTAVAADPDNRSYRDRLALTLVNLAGFLGKIHRTQDSVEPAREALELRRGLWRGPAATGDDGHSLVMALKALGSALRDTGQTAAAEEMLREAIATGRRLSAEYPAVPVHRESLAQSLAHLGIILGRAGRAADAEPLFRDALALRKQLAADFPGDRRHERNVADAHSDLGVTLHIAGKFADAEAAYRESAAVKRRLVAAGGGPDDRSDLGQQLNNLGIMLRAAGRRDEARPVLAEALAVYRGLQEADPKSVKYRFWVGKAESSLGSLDLDAGEYAAAVEAYRRSEALLAGVVREQPRVALARQELNLVRHNLANILSEQKKWPESEAATREAVAGHRALVAEDPKNNHYRFELGDMLLRLSQARLAQGDAADAAAHLAEALPLRDAALKTNPTHAAYRRLARQTRIQAAKLAALRGDADAARREADAIAGLGFDPVEDAKSAATALAVSASLTTGDAAKAYADDALARLRLAVEKGYGNAESLAKDDDFAALRDRPEFTALLEEMAKPKR